MEPVHRILQSFMMGIKINNGNGTDRCKVKPLMHPSYTYTYSTRTYTRKLKMRISVYFTRMPKKLTEFSKKVLAASSILSSFSLRSLLPSFNKSTVQSNTLGSELGTFG
jgi:hypothetical protein